MAGSDIHLRGTGKHAQKLDRDEPISMLIRFWSNGGGEIAIFVPGSLCTLQHHHGSVGKSTFHAADWQGEVGGEGKKSRCQCA